jgi:ABC-type transport system involved in cytochrome bd biosynthesis fused ATPase/permease subunit
VIFDVSIAGSSRLEHKVFCLSTLKLEAAETFETLAPTCQIYDAVLQKTDILNSLQGDEGKIQLKFLKLSFLIFVLLLFCSIVFGVGILFAVVALAFHLLLSDTSCHTLFSCCAFA